ncbi:unnamed protein product, partial [Brachionus calyciflorus]
TIEYAVASENLSLSAIRTVRVLRPLRAINRVPSMRILVMLLLDTLPMLGNVLLLCFFVFFIFGIVGVQLWKGILRNRCFFDYNETLMGDFLDKSFQDTYFKPELVDSFICSNASSGGMTTCADIPPFINNSRICNATIDLLHSPPSNLSSRACINWNHYYSKCRPSDRNPFKGAISFDNIGYAWVAIFQIISLESWVTIMYYIQDSHSFWNWIYFVFLIVIGSFFMINLCLVVIATQFSETKKRETERMIAERRRFSRSSSTLFSDSGGEPGSCWEEFLKYAGHLFRKTKRRLLRKYNQYKLNRKKSIKEKTLKLTKKPISKNETVKLCNNNNSSENAVISCNKMNLNCKCKCHVLSFYEKNTNNIVEMDNKDLDKIDPNNNYTKDPNLSTELNSLNKNTETISKKSENFENDSNTDTIPNNQISIMKSKNVDERCSQCNHSKKFDINHKKVLNLDDSAILSFSITSANSNTLNRNVNKLKNNSDLQYFKDNASKHPIDNQEYFYCYSANQSMMFDINSNFDELSYLKENNNNVDLGDAYTRNLDSKTITDRKNRNKLRKAKQTKNTNCCLSCCFCCSRKLSNTRICLFINIINKKLKSFVDGKLFQRTILFSILINTFCMGIEHHEQPLTLTLIVEYSNTFFTFIFLIEMVLKIIAYGVYDYIKNAFNLLDGVIVCISCYEVSKQLLSNSTDQIVVASGVSVLRTFRLLRILKLVRFMPALRRQLIVMLKTIDNVATFFSLLVLFIFIFSILGMNLFGCKFCTKDPNGHRVCERKNFDSLLWATITVFQVLTQEDWNEVLYNGMEKTSSWAALYFIALMTFGNYVLFNLLVAILVEGFSTEDEPKKAIEDRIIEDAMQAIAEEHSRESGQSNLSRRNSRKKSRKSSNCSIDANLVKNLEPPEINVNDTSKEEVKIVENTCLKRENLTLDLNQKNKKLIHLPIITHTCPTPNYSPSNSTRNSPLLKSLPILKTTRKLSLDSAYDRLKLQKNQTNFVLNQSTTTKIYDKKEKIIKGARSDNVNLATIKLESILKTIDSKRRIQLTPKKIEFQFSDNSSEKDSVITNYSRQEETDEKKQENFLLGKKRLSQSFNEKSLDNPSSLTVPKYIFRRQRSKSERLKNRTNKIFDQEEIRLSLDDKINQEKFSSNNKSEAQNHLKDDSLLISINNIKPVVIKKSEPFNIDLNLSYSLQNDKIDRDEKIISNKKKVKLDFGILSGLTKPTGCFKQREEYSLFIFSTDNVIRLKCKQIIEKKWFDYSVLFFIALNCITLAMERPNIPQNSKERKFLTYSNHIFTYIFALEMFIKVIAHGFSIGKNAYLKSGWNKMDGILVIISLIDSFVTLTARSSPKIFGILRVFRLLRTLRPLRVISRAPGLKLVVQTLLSSLRPIGNIVLICCTFFIIFGILGVQLFKGKLYRCVGPYVDDVKTKNDCLAKHENQWVNSQYNFDNLGQALMALFVLSSKDGWVQIMYTGIDAVGVDKQPIQNYNEWMLLYFISFLLLVGFFVLNMFVGVIIENFHKCRAEQEREEKARRAAKRAKKFEIKRIKMKEIPYYANYSRARRLLHDLCNSKYFDLVIAGVIGLNVVSMSLEFYRMPPFLGDVLDLLNIIFTVIFSIEAVMRLVALGFFRYFKERWNQLDILIVILSIIGIVFDRLDSKQTIPINPTIIRVMRVLRIARVLKLLKMAKGIRSLLDTVIQALPQVGNLGLLFFLLFFIFAILGVELFGKLNCESTRSACDGLSKHAHFHNFGMAFLTLFRIATGDNWNGIMKDTLKDNILCQDDPGKPPSSMCLASFLAPIYFVIFVLMAQFVLVNVVVAVLMKHLDDSNKMMADDADMDEEIEKQLEDEARNNIYNEQTIKLDDDFEDQNYHRMTKQNSLPPNFIFDLKSESSITQILKHSNAQIKEGDTRSQNSEEVEKSNSEENEVYATSDKFKSPVRNENFKLVEMDRNSFSVNLSTPNESDATSEKIRLRRNRKNKKIAYVDDDDVKSHFSPKSSLRIRVIDETDTDNNDYS